MRVEFKQTFSDILIFILLHNFLSKKLQLWATALSGVTAVAMFAFDANLASMVQGAAIAYAVFWLGLTLLLVISLRVQGIEKLTGFKAIELQNDALFEQTHLNQAYHYWPNIVKIVRRPGSITVYINASGAAHVIPTRAFANKQARDTFWLALQQHWQSGAGQAQQPDLILARSPDATRDPTGTTSDRMPKHLLGACVLHIGARGAMAVLASLYESGNFRVISPVLMLLFVMIVVLFMRRVRRTWLWAGTVAFAEIVIGFTFFPRPGYANGYLELSQFFTALLIAASCVILWSIVWRRQTRTWFQRT